MSVHKNFESFCNNLRITNRDDISQRYKEITKRLNRDFYSSDSDTEHSLYVGSYGRGTAIRGFSDLDMIFILPVGTFSKYHNYSGNGQSALLQAVRNSIKQRYAKTEVGADGQVVEVAFADGMIFEVVPGVKKDDGSFYYPDTNDGGKWKSTNPQPEINRVNFSDKRWNGNLRWLARMTRAWREKWNVEMGGLLIDTLAYNFLLTWKYQDKGFTYYDWMSRDFFYYLSSRDRDQSYWEAVGSMQHVYRKGPFEYKAKQCYGLAKEAISLETEKYVYLARAKWREIYGSRY